jgi:hypothetical protein
MSVETDPKKFCREVDPPYETNEAVLGENAR